MIAFATTAPAVWYLMRATGVVALVLLTAVVALGIATARHWAPPRLPSFVTVGLHRSLSLLAVLFVAVHVATAVVDPDAGVALGAVLVPGLASRSPLWVGLGALALDVLLVLVATSLLRHRLRPRHWRAVHWLAYLSWPFAFAHGLGRGSDAGRVWFLAISGACAALVGAAAFWRFASPSSDPKYLNARAPRPVTCAASADARDPGRVAA